PLSGRLPARPLRRGGVAVVRRPRLRGQRHAGRRPLRRDDGAVRGGPAGVAGHRRPETERGGMMNGGTLSGALFAVVTWLVQATVKGSVAIVLIAVAYVVIGRRVPARWWYALWLVVVLRLVVPIAPSSPWSLFNLVPMRPGLQLQLRGAAAQMLFDLAPGGLPFIGVPWWIASWRWLAVVWLAGFTVMLLRVFFATIRMQSLVLRALESGGATPVA